MAAPLAKLTLEPLDETWKTLDTAARRHLGESSTREILVSEYVRGPVEAYIGLVRDPEWGPIVSVGLGGNLIEQLADAELVPAPASPEELEDAVRRTELASVLAVHSIGDDVTASFVDAAVKVGWLAARNPHITEIDLNPVITSRERIVVVDALIVANGGDE